MVECFKCKTPNYPTATECRRCQESLQVVKLFKQYTTPKQERPQIAKPALNFKAREKKEVPPKGRAVKALIISAIVAGVIYWWFY